MVREDRLFPLQHGEPFSRIRFEGCSSIFSTRPVLSSPLSFLVRIRFSLISVSTLLLCFKISCYLAGLLFCPLAPLFHSSLPVREQHGRRRNVQRAPFGRFVPGFFKFRPVRPVDWPVKTGRKKMAAILGQLARSMPTLPSVRLCLDFFEHPFRELNANL